jgi:hypothetical protein
VLDVGLFLTVIGVLLAVPILWVVGLGLVVFGTFRWLVGAARYLLSRFPAPQSLTTVSH